MLGGMRLGEKPARSLYLALTLAVIYVVTNLHRDTAHGRNAGVSA